MKTLYYIPLLLIVAACNSNQKPIDDTATDIVSDSVDTINADEDTIQDIDSANYSRYYNLRYAYRVDFPKKLLTAQPEADNGDGRVFTDNKGNVILTVYGSSVDYLSTVYKSMVDSTQSKQNKITYDSSGVVSGFKGEAVFYYKRIFTNRGIVAIMLEYPKVDSVKYKTVVNAVSRSLRKIKVEEEGGGKE